MRRKRMREESATPLEHAKRPLFAALRKFAVVRTNEVW